MCGLWTLFLGVEGLSCTTAALRPNFNLARNRHTEAPHRDWLWLQAVTLALKGMEAKHAAERQLQEQRLVVERNKAAKAAEAADAAMLALKGRILQLQGALVELSTYSFSHACVSTSDKVPLLDRDCTSTSGNRSSGGGASASPRSNTRSSGGGSKSVPLLPLGGHEQQLQPLNWGPVLSAGLGPQPVSAVGERWLYMHLPEGPWRKARQLLLQPQQELPEGLMRQGSSGECQHTILKTSEQHSACSPASSAVSGLFPAEHL